MLNLIKADLYRITRARGLRGSLWQYGLAVTAAYAIVVGLMVFAKTQAYADISGGAASPVPADFTTFTAYLASMLGGLVPLCACFMVVEHGLQELKNGFVRSLLSARAGRLSLFGSRIVSAGVVAAIMVLFSVALVTVGAVVGGFSFRAVDAPLGLIAWGMGFWLNTWALATLSLVLVYATRVSPVSYIGAFCFCGAVVPNTFTGLASIGGVFPALQPIMELVRPVLETLAAWMPTTSLDNLAAGAELFSMTSADVWGAGSYALTIAPGVQALLTGVIWIALGAVVVLAICRKRDV